MFVVTAVLSVLLAAVLLESARGKLAGDRAQLETLDRIGVPRSLVPSLAWFQGAGGVGLLAGLLWWPLGVLGALLAAGYFLGAVAAHLLRSDIRVGARLVAVATAVLVLGLRVLTA